MVCVNRELDDDRVWSPGRYEGIRERTCLDVSIFEEPEYVIEEIYWLGDTKSRQPVSRFKPEHFDVMLLLGVCGLAGMLLGALIRLL